MKALITILLATVAAHLVGAMVFFGVMGGLDGGFLTALEAVFLAPMLSIFGWFFLFPEVIFVTIQWFLCRPTDRKKKIRFLLMSALIGVAIASAFSLYPLFGAISKSAAFAFSPRFAITLALSGALAATASGAIIQVVKTSKVLSSLTANSRR